MLDDPATEAVVVGTLRILIGEERITDVPEKHRERVRAEVFGLTGDLGKERFDGLVKLITGIVSIATALALIPVVPKALAFRSPAELEVEVAAHTDGAGERR